MTDLTFTEEIQAIRRAMTYAENADVVDLVMKAQLDKAYTQGYNDATDDLY